MSRPIRSFSTRILRQSQRESHGSEVNSPRDRLRFTSSNSNPPPPPTESSAGLILQPRELTTSGGLPLPSHNYVPRPRIAFNTLDFVKRLEEAEFNRSLATEMMHATRNLLVVREERASRELLSRSDLDNVRDYWFEGEGEC